MSETVAIFNTPRCYYHIILISRYFDIFSSLKDLNYVTENYRRTICYRVTLLAKSNNDSSSKSIRRRENEDILLYFMIHSGIYSLNTQHLSFTFFVPFDMYAANISNYIKKDLL